MTDDRTEGQVDTMKGRAREAYGDLTGDEDQKAQGEAEQTQGQAKKVVGDVKQTVKDATDQG